MVKKVATLHQKHSLLRLSSPSLILLPPFAPPAAPLPSLCNGGGRRVHLRSSRSAKCVVFHHEGTQSGGGGGGRATVNPSEETIPSVRQGEGPHTTGSGTSNQSCKSGSSSHIFRTAAERGGYPGLKAALVPIILNLIEVARLEARNIDRE